MSDKIKIDPELKEEWEGKLEELGLGEDVSDPHEVPIEKVTDSELMPEIIKEMLVDFSSLPEKLQEDILAEIKKCRDAGESFENISKRAKTLVIKAQELSAMDDTDSDRSYHAVKEADNLAEEDESDAESVDEFIEKLEKLVNRESKEQKAETIH